MDLNNSKIRKNVAENLKYYRKKYELSQANVSKTLGVDASSYRNWENERSVPGIATLNEIAKMYKISIYTLCGIENPNDEKQSISSNSQFNNNVYGEDKITNLDTFEKQIVMQLRRLTKEDQRKVGECITELLKNNE